MFDQKISKTSSLDVADFLYFTNIPWILWELKYSLTVAWVNIPEIHFAYSRRCAQKCKFYCDTNKRSPSASFAVGVFLRFLDKTSIGLVRCHEQVVDSFAKFSVAFLILFAAPLSWITMSEFLVKSLDEASLRLDHNSIEAASNFARITDCFQIENFLYSLLIFMTVVLRALLRVE